jgi:hypothetical protein
MVGQGGNALLFQPGSGFVDFLARKAIHDAGRTTISGEEIEQLPTRVVAFDHGVADVGSVEAGNEYARRIESEARDDLLPGQLIRRRGQGDARHLRVALVQGRELDVLGTEIVPPLRDAMGLVDGEQGQASALLEVIHQCEEAIGQQALRGDIDQVEFVCTQLAFDFGGRGKILRGIEEGGPHPGLQEGVDLILHQRDQRGNYHADAPAQHGRDLVAEGLAATGRHQDQCIATADQVADDLLLRPAERGIAENAAQCVEGSGHAGAVQGGAGACIMPARRACSGIQLESGSRPRLTRVMSPPAQASTRGFMMANHSGGTAATVNIRA